MTLKGCSRLNVGTQLVFTVWLIGYDGKKRWIHDHLEEWVLYRKSEIATWHSVTKITQAWEIRFHTNFGCWQQKPTAQALFKEDTMNVRLHSLINNLYVLRMSSQVQNAEIAFAFLRQKCFFKFYAHQKWSCSFFMKKKFHVHSIHRLNKYFLYVTKSLQKSFASANNGPRRPG